ncbi:Predicted arabinose efflux permease, MFS family [Streptomyces sp. 2224.1]|uniref:MFS transporter n=2 Tax=Streptomyces TaxID=1883 RepID=UPI0008844ED8|nr:putative MFS family arabinose efflux permease [Streptomyces sp. 2321.6]SDR00017.1 Predicted arabinose efflux permease, MFS family [Streptomyces sp. KS_16]SED84997.1 Predicted arabinose efflux permease, MFS family [Streptomyces sp. 2133.1]SED88084.1 Predicted arabinose efflux permease, MFS family [Streptomyces sp. 2112.3]SEE05037.1 Predicted arabinose efflux permease, MFS family [Streptomyces sp. 2224.1]SNC72866.1 Predicted arabinose efflux permease, MFS family [Streptomyces sp. 2114.4]
MASTNATTTYHSGRVDLPARSPLIGWLAVVSVMLGIFSIVTTEILPIGLLTKIGSSFAISDGVAGLMMTMPGILAAISAPVITVATAHIDRRLMLCVFMLMLAGANFLAAAAPDYWLVLVSRVIVGVVIGGFWSIGAGLAQRLVPAASVGRATSVIFSAVPLGSVLGVPAGTFIGDLAGWRTAFVVMGALTVGVLVMLLLVMPPLPPNQRTRLSVLRGMCKSVNTRFALLLTFLVVLAHFGTYTYLTPFLEQVTDASSQLITGFLLVYGAAGIVGNFLGGAVVTRYPRAAFGLAAGMIAAVTLLLPVLGRWQIGAVALLIVWGVAYGAVPVSSQTWFTKATPHAPEAASVLFTASFQATISLGALAGGVIVDRTSPSTVMTLGGLAAALMVVAAWAHFARRLTWPDNA